MGHYVIGDIHGCFDEFQALIAKIDKMDPDANYILVGDIIDRGEQQMEMLRFAMENVNKPGSRFQMIMGNHEYEKIYYLDAFLDSEEANQPKMIRKYFWGDPYEFAKVLEEQMVSVQEIKDIYQFFTGLPYYLEVDTKLSGKNQHYIIVHGALPYECINQDGTFRKRSIMTKQDDYFNRIGRRSMKKHLVWDRSNGMSSNIGNSIIVHGHTPTIDESLAYDGAIPGRILYRNHDINVDCGITFKDRISAANLAAIRLEDLQEFYLYETEDVLPSDYRDGGLQFKEKMLHRPRKKRTKLISAMDEVLEMIENEYWQSI